MSGDKPAVLVTQSVDYDYSSLSMVSEFLYLGLDIFSLFPLYLDTSSTVWLLDTQEIYRYCHRDG